MFGGFYEIFRGCGEGSKSLGASVGGDFRLVLAPTDPVCPGGLDLRRVLTSIKMDIFDQAR